MKQHTVPQNIMSVEFKIFGDLSIRQFIYMSIAGGLSFFFYLIPLPGIIKVTFIVISIIIGILLTFGKVNERPFDQWINSFITAILLPTQRVWKKTVTVPYFFMDDFEVEHPEKKNKGDEGYNKVINYIHSRNLPTDEVYKTNTRMDIEEIKILTNIDKLFNESTIIDAKVPDDVIDQTFKSIASMQAAPVSVIDPAPIASPPINKPVQSDNIVHVDNASTANTPITIKNNQTATMDSFTMPPQTASVPQDDQKEVSTLPLSQPVSMPEFPDLQAPAEPDDGGDVFTIEPDTVVKLEDLKNLKSSILDTIDDELKSISQAPVMESIPPVIKDEEQAIIPPVTAPFVVNNTQPVQEVTPQAPSAEVVIEDDPVAKLQEENRKLREQLEKMQNTVKEPEAETVHEEEKVSNQIFGHMPDFIKYPNIISGAVFDSNGKQIEDVVVIIKDKSKRIMRAMKTNILGQYYSRNPLMNGSYNLEANKEGYIFEEASVDLNGEMVKPILIRPKKFNQTETSNVTI